MSGTLASRASGGNGAPALLSVAVDAAECLSGGGAMGALMRSTDWARTALGPVSEWPQSLRTSVSICLGTSFPMMIAWGPQLHMLYNDGYLPVLGTKKHPRALGRPLLECFPEIRDLLESMFGGVMKSGTPIGATDMMFPLERHGYTEETYFVFSYSPIRDESGRVGGVLTTCTETTERVVGERRLRTLRALAEGAVNAVTAEDALERAARTLDRADTPFALLYLVDAGGDLARLVAHTGIDLDLPASPRVLRTDARDPWPFGRCAVTRKAEWVESLPPGLGMLPGGNWPEPTTQAMVLPINRPGQAYPYGFLVAGISPRRALDESYRGYLELVADHIATAVANARAREEERRRAESLAELDRAKTAFFSNVSHEFRTPLTLMLGPIEDVLAGARGDAAPFVREQLALAHRNALRLLKLVNSLLDFARIEAGRMQVSYEPLDLAALTIDIASAFRSAIERAGLRFSVRALPVPEPVYVDVEMWEKIVLNLLSNALKFTFEGEIALELRPNGDVVELEVRDTGVGIPRHELPNLFRRFYRIQGARSRTHEGSGIGLALVQDLLRLHGGQIRCESEVDRGTTFTATVRLGTAHLPEDRIGAPPNHASNAIRADAYVEEALRWLPDGSADLAAPHDYARPVAISSGRDRVLIADDNADIRSYLCRILGEHWTVEAAADGGAALEAARRRPPDLVLADVMMPVLDGLGLLRELRLDDRTRQIPVVLLSARAGEEARIDGLNAGADDYLIKPFSARELVARVSSQLAIGRTRRLVEEQRAILYTIFKHMPAAVSVVQGPEFVYEMINDHGAEVSGKKPDEILGRPAFEVFPELRGQGFEEILLRVMRTGAPFVGREVPLRYDLDGDGIDETTYWNLAVTRLPDEPGRTGRVMSFGYNVTDLVVARREVEAAKKNAELHEQHLRALFMQAPTPICILRGPQYVIELANPQCAEVWGRKREEVIGRPLFEALPEIEGQVFNELLHGVLTTGEPYVGKEIPGELGPPGARRTIHFNFVYAPLRSPSGSVDGILVIAFDVSDEIRARDELQRTLRYNEMFAGILGHDLRNPLGSIVTAAQLLLRRSNDEKIAGPAARIVASGERMSRMIEQLLDYTKARIGGGLALDRKPCDVAEVVRRAVSEIESANGKLRFEIHASGDTMGNWDPDRLCQVFSNLAANAVHHGSADRPPQVEIDARSATSVTVRFQNAGVIPDELLPVLFDPFRGTQNCRANANGLGLGLFISKELVIAHGGEITGTSSGGEVCFCLVLPRAVDGGMKGSAR